MFTGVFFFLVARKMRQKAELGTERVIMNNDKLLGVRKARKSKRKKKRGKARRSSNPGSNLPRE